MFLFFFFSLQQSIPLVMKLTTFLSNLQKNDQTLNVMMENASSLQLNTGGKGAKTGGDALWQVLNNVFSMWHRWFILDKLELALNDEQVPVVTQSSERRSGPQCLTKVRRSGGK
jgi:hypothetical protein